jgi:hypothetical protein
MFTRVTGLFVAVVALGVLGLAAPAAARDSVQADVVAPSTMSLGRIGAIVANVVGLSGAVLGGLALARFARRLETGNPRRGAIVAIVAGLIGMALGGLVASASTGGVGTGRGVGGAIVAMAVGLIAITLGAVALARSRRTA